MCLSPNLKLTTMTTSIDRMTQCESEDSTNRIGLLTKQSQVGVEDDDKLMSPFERTSTEDIASCSLGAQ